MARNNDLDTRIVFTLADFLKSQDPEQYYGTLFPPYMIDTAERLFKVWEAGPNTNGASRGARSVVECLVHAIGRVAFTSINRMALSGKRPPQERFEDSAEGEEKAQEVRRSNCKVRFASPICHPAVDSEQDGAEPAHAERDQT